ncbi:MAG: hypothetical protein ACR2RF_22055, partial [Geminicoccaceae bacterium]
WLMPLNVLILRAIRRWQGKDVGGQVRQVIACIAFFDVTGGDPSYGHTERLVVMAEPRPDQPWVKRTDCGADSSAVRGLASPEAST